MEKEVGIFTHEELVGKCQDNPWLKVGGVVFEDDLCMEEDYKYCFSECESIVILLSQIAKGNWSIRQGFVYNSLAFINQVDGGDEWWAVKKFSDGTLKSFDSITFEGMIKRGTVFSGKNILKVIEALESADNTDELDKAWYN